MAQEVNMSMKIDVLAFLRSKPVYGMAECEGAFYLLLRGISDIMI